MKSKLAFKIFFFALVAGSICYASLWVLYAVEWLLEPPGLEWWGGGCLAMGVTAAVKENFEKS